MCEEIQTVAGVETGGTSIKVAIYRGKFEASEDFLVNVLEKQTFPTSHTNPEETIRKVIDWLSARKFSALGIASFGPLDLKRDSATYGFITSTPKENWKYFDLLGYFKKAFGSKMKYADIGFDTDVNAPAITELLIGKHAHVKSSVAYVTVGTGVGVGLCLSGQAVHGLIHPEAGHMFIPMVKEDMISNFVGVCGYHQNCLEGLTTNHAIAKRKKISIEDLDKVSNDDPVWDIEAEYLAYLMVNLILTTSVEVIVVGGGIFKRKCLLPKIRERTLKLLNGYVANEMILKNIDQYIVASRFGEDSGIMGAIGLAYLSIKKRN